MRRRLAWIAVTLALAACVHLLTVKAVPYFVMIFLGESEGELNTLTHAEPVTSDSRTVVMPSPDMLYSACGYNLTDGPLRITAPVPDTYWSMSLYALNTDNFYVINDRQIGSKHLDAVLVSKGETYPAREGQLVIEAPVDFGAVLFRILIDDRDRLDELIEYQKQAEVRSAD